MKVPKEHTDFHVAQVSGLTPKEYLALAMACLDQAGVNIGVQQKIRRILLTYWGEEFD